MSNLLRPLAVLLLTVATACVSGTPELALEHARRGEKAPGFLDERAFSFDDAVADALAAGDPGPLRDLDVTLAAELMVGGRSVLRLLGLLGDRARPTHAALTHREDPYGVSYLVARWDLG